MSSNIRAGIPLTSLSPETFPELHQLLGPVATRYGLAPFNSFVVHTHPIFTCGWTDSIRQLAIPYPAALILNDEELQIGAIKALEFFGPMSSPDTGDLEWYSKVIRGLTKKIELEKLAVSMIKEEYSTTMWHRILQLNVGKKPGDANGPIQMFLHRNEQQFIPTLEAAVELYGQDLEMLPSAKVVIETLGLNWKEMLFTAYESLDTPSTLLLKLQSLHNDFDEMILEQLAA